MHLQLIRWRSHIWLLNGTGIIFTPLALMKFEHRILIIQPVSYNLCFYRILPVSASPVFLPMQYLSRFPVYSCRSVGLLSSGSFSASLLAYKLHLNSTTVCFVYKRSTHWSGQVITATADRSVGLWPAPPRAPTHANLLAIAMIALWRPRRFAISHAQRLRICFVLRFGAPQY